MHIMKTLSLSALSLLVSGCATVAGVGKDVSAVGRGITHVADEVRDEVFLRNHTHANQTRYRSASQPTVRVSEPCDPHPERASVSGLTPCAAVVNFR